MKNLLKSIKDKEYFILYIYLYIFLMPWNFFKWQMGVLSVILFIWWIVKYRSIIYKKLNMLITFKPIFILIIFILYTYLSTLWSNSFEEGMNHVNKFHKYYIFIILPLFLSLKEKEALVSMKVLLVSFGSYSLFSLSIFFGLFSIESTSSNIDNPKGIMAYAIMSVYMAIGALISFLVAKDSKINYEKNIFYLISLLCFFTLFINKSRTAQLAFVLTLIILLLIYSRKYIFNIKNILIGLTSTIVILFSSFYILNETGKLKRYIAAYNETEKIFKEDNYKGSLGVRIYFNIVGFKVFIEEPIFGSGPEDNISKFIEYQKNDQNVILKKIYRSYHSQHIDYLTRYGIFGYILFIASALFLLRLLYNNKKLYYMYMSFLLVVFFSSLTNVMLIKKPFNYVYITVFVLFSVIAYYQNKNEKQDAKIS